MGDEVKTAAEAYEEAALPRMHEVHTGADQPKSGDQPLPKSVTDKPVKQKSPAQWAYERVVLYLKNFEEKLDNDHEAAIGLPGRRRGAADRRHGVFRPRHHHFYGVDPAGARAQLVQHVGQLNVMLRALPKKVPDAAPQRIGFRLVADLEET